MKSRTQCALPYQVLCWACLVMLAFMGTAQSQEWTRFRGSNGDGLGQGSNIPAQWTEKDYLWKVQLPGEGHSSPVLWGDRIFLTSADAATAQRTLLCLGATDGAVLWARQYQGKTFAKNTDNSYAAASATADAQRVYFHWAAPEGSYLLALDHQGKELWKVSLGIYKSQHGGGASPMLFEDMVILPVDHEGSGSFLIAVDRDTGQTRWKTPRKSTSAAASTPCLYQPAQEPAQVIVTSRTEGVAGFNARTGEELWKLADVLDRRVVASPVVGGNLVFANCGEGVKGRVLVAARPGTKGSKATVAYQITTDAPYVPTPLVAGKRLFLWTDTGVVSCLDLETGKVLWQGRVNAPFYSSPVFVAGRLYNVSKQGEVFVVATGDQFELLAKNPLGQTCFASPAVAGGRMYIRTVSHLICIGAKSLVMNQ